ncbi:fatty acid desaturase [Halomicronema sp. CCY15110]|uniref:fatty acid desaturase family protein n=1 Tax=Halomicronema sp. CCY15110 TaxID=2767773 RepID=UPI00194F864F|nr:fatty acid desaturase [Halomicronema sp. CCY15110]
MNLKSQIDYISQPEYAKKLRPLMPPEAFQPNSNNVLILLINGLILICGWGIASRLDQWDWRLWWLFLPFSLIMGNSIVVSLFCTHDILHSKVIRNARLRQLLGLLGLTMLWTPPTFWKAVHNREHHNKSNSLHDPDRNYLSSHPQNWGKRIQDLFVPSNEVNPLWLIIGMANAWGVHTFRNLSSVLLFNNGEAQYPVVSFRVSAKERRAIALELAMMALLHVGILSYLGWHPIKLILSYFLPIWIGYSGALFYIYTNHMACRMTPVNDPLINSISLRVPKIFDVLHLNFSYHTEHHIFPGMNSDYYPVLQQLLLTHYPERFNLLSAQEAWKILLTTPRHYLDENTFTTWSEEYSVTCPLSSRAPSVSNGDIETSPQTLTL